MKTRIFLITIALFTVKFTYAQWEPDVRLTYNPYTTGSAGIATSGDTLHVLVNTYPAPGTFELDYLRSVDGGSTWEPAIQLTDPPSYACLPCIITSGPVVQVAWNDTVLNPPWTNQIHYIRSADGGTTWGEPTRITDNPGGSGIPCLAVSDSITHLVYAGDSDGEIYYRRSLDLGLNWEGYIQLTYNSAKSSWPYVCASDSLVHVAWEDIRDGNIEIYYKRSADWGLTWGEDTRLTYNDSSSLLPVIGAFGTDVYMVWCDRSEGNREIYFIRSMDGGLTWEADTRLTYDFNYSINADLAVSGDALYVVWSDWRDDSSEIYFKKSADGGLTWDPDTRLTFDAAQSYRPSISISGAQLNIVWSDKRDGISETYYKRDPNGNLPVGIMDDFVSNEERHFCVFPNPARSQLIVGQLDSWTVGQSVVKVSIVDLFGRKVKASGQLFSFPYQVDISDLPNGIYIMKVYDDSGNIGAVKFVKR